MNLDHNKPFRLEFLPPKKHIFTVSEITQYIKLILEGAFPEGIWVEGEISNFRKATSGHFYFSLKDEGAVLSAAMFSWTNREIRFELMDGLKVICFGKIDVYPPRGTYQFIVECIEPKGLGARQLAFEQLKQKLYKEGVFDPAHKKPLVLMPFSVGIITSLAGAALRDILQILKKGAPCVNVIIRSVRVQGDYAAEEINLAIEEFNEFKGVDVIILARGGGSIEDLWVFNEEKVARAIYKSKISIISAVGHQINTTLADMVADVSVETPSAAAKIIVEKKNNLLAELNTYRYELYSHIKEKIHSLNSKLVGLRHMLKSPQDSLLEKQQLLDELVSYLVKNMLYYLNIIRHQLSGVIDRLAALSPLSVLARGYSLTMLMPKKEIITDAKRLKVGDITKTVLEKGAFLSKVKEVIFDEGEQKL